MSEKQKTLTLTLDEQPVALTINQATARVGVKRYLLASEGVKVNETETDEALKILRVTLFPDLMSVTTGNDDFPLPMPFEEFVELPESFVNDWADGVYSMNPTWRPEITPAEGSQAEKEKKVVKRHSGKSSKSG